MARFFKKRTQTKGLAPGSLVFVGQQKLDSPSLKIINYDEKDIEEIDLPTSEDILQAKGKKAVSWLNIYGIHDFQNSNCKYAGN